MKTALLLCLICTLSSAASDVTFGTVQQGKQKPKPLSWQSRGSGHWRVMQDGTLTGQRDLINAGPRKNWFESQKLFRHWLDQQAWIYTEAEYGNFDLQFDYWLRFEGNSGIAVWDPTRGEAGITEPPNYQKTPSKVAYEIQLNNQFPDPKPSGSIYNVEQAKTGVQKDDDWNTIKVEGRSDRLRIFINGQLVAEHATLPDRPKQGPIGLQLHDQFSVMMIRNLKLTSF